MVCALWFIETLMTYLFFILGFVLIYYGSEWFVSAAESLAIHLRWSPLLVGIIIMGFGTSAPEIAISIYSSLGGHAAIVVGNIVGSNITNVLLVLGVGLLLLKHTKQVFHPHYSSAVVFIVATVLLLVGLCQHSFSRGFGLVFLLLAIISGWWLCRAQRQQADLEAVKPPLTLVRAIALLLMGLVALVVSANWIVAGVVALANLLGIETGFLAMSLVALGTSLPEVAVSVTAARRGELALVMGNILGSNVSNIFLGIGLPALLSEMKLVSLSYATESVLLIVTGLLYLLLLYSKTLLKRSVGLLLVLGFVAFMIYCFS